MDKHPERKKATALAGHDRASGKALAKAHDKAPDTPQIGRRPEAKKPPRPSPSIAGPHAVDGPAAPVGAELEFKFTVPPSRSGDIAAELNRHPSAQCLSLDARYLDTPDDALAAAGLSLRLRAQDGRWVQTLKAQSGHGNLQRAEHEVTLEATGDHPPAVDLHRHQGTAAGDQAITLLRQLASDRGHDAAALVQRYRARVKRTVSRVPFGRSVIEVGLDQGELEAGTQRVLVNELEYELKHGSVADLCALARDGLQRHGLWLLAESKPERGRRLARREPAPAVAKAAPLQFDTQAGPEAMARAAFANGLAQVLPNASAVAEGSTDADHVHQLRVGLRRLRTVMRDMQRLSREMPLRIEPVLARVFRRLGEQRDHEQVLQTIKPLLQEAGAAQAGWATAPAPPVQMAELVKACAFQTALLEVAQFAFSPPPAKAAQGTTALRKRLRPGLQRLHTQVVRGGDRFRELPADGQHQVRKRLKRLRYLSEFAAPVFGDAGVARYLEALKPAQDVLGHHNDLAVAEALAARRPASDEAARFAVRWLKHAQAKTARQAHKALRRVAEAERFWA